MFLRGKPERYGTHVTQAEKERVAREKGALAFLTFGVTRALPEPIPVSVGARFLFIPASVVLWPLVLQRWLKAAHMNSHARSTPDLARARARGSIRLRHGARARGPPTTTPPPTETRR
jgi:hypothetical protein